MAPTSLCPEFCTVRCCAAPTLTLEFAQGIGWALYEGYAYDEQGRMLNPNLLDYKLPTALDVPPIETVIVEAPYPKHPFGIRGVGENPIVPSLAVIANAIYRAIGKRIDQLPMTPARILEKMEVI